MLEGDGVVVIPGIVIILLIKNWHLDFMSKHFLHSPSIITQNNQIVKPNSQANCLFYRNTHTHTQSPQSISNLIF